MATLDPKRISGRDMEILYRHACGMDHKAIAEDLQITYQTVSNTINSSWARNELALLHARTMEKIANGTYSPLALARSVANEAMAIQIALMRSPQVRANVRARIADSLLDRAGYRPVTRIESLDVNDMLEQMSAEEADHYATSGEIPERFNGTQVHRFLANSRDVEPGSEARSAVIEILPEPGPGTKSTSTSTSRESESELECIEIEVD